MRPKKCAVGQECKSCSGKILTLEELIRCAKSCFPDIVRRLHEYFFLPPQESRPAYGNRAMQVHTLHTRPRGRFHRKQNKNVSSFAPSFYQLLVYEFTERSQLEPAPSRHQISWLGFWLRGLACNITTAKSSQHYRLLTQKSRWGEWSYSLW